MTALLLASVLSAPPAVPAETATRYYVILFGGQGVPFRPRTAHTWATYVRVTPTPGGPLIIEPRTISWMPETSTVHPLNPLPERGKNYTLEETFAVMARHNAHVSYWGPYEVDAARFQLACEQIDRLGGGGMRYRMIDSFLLTSDICHCAHAVTGADPVMKRLVVPVLRVGEPGTSTLAARYRNNGAFVGGEVTHDWLVPWLGLDRHGAVKRDAGEWIARRLW